jgi:hypothetical protein
MWQSPAGVLPRRFFCALVESNWPGSARSWRDGEFFARRKMKHVDATESEGEYRGATRDHFQLHEGESGWITPAF